MLCLLTGAAACPSAPARPAAPAATGSPPPAGEVKPSPLGEDNEHSVAHLVPAADAAPGRRVRRQTAVLLFSPRFDPAEPPAERTFQPLVCVIDGKRETGARCGEIMPAQATIRTARGALAVARSTQPFHDEAGEQDYPAPYGPACCMYNTCVGRTVPYRAAEVGDPRTQLAVWPADADLALEVAATSIASDIQPPLAPEQRVEAAFHRGPRSYAALRSRSGGAIAWRDTGAWAITHPDLGVRGYTLLATSDVDHDGHPELIAWQRWANDYGLDVYGDAAAPLYSFSCGNI